MNQSNRTLEIFNTWSSIIFSLLPPVISLESLTAKKNCNPHRIKHYIFESIQFSSRNFQYMIIYYQFSSLQPPLVSLESKKKKKNAAHTGYNTIYLNQSNWAWEFFNTRSSNISFSPLMKFSALINALNV